MKKIVTSSVFIIAFSAYALFQYFGSSHAAPADISTVANDPNNTVSNTPPMTSAPTESLNPGTKKGSSTTPAPSAKQQGQYADGTYTGSAADAYYGTVQVRASISAGRITDISFLQYPNDRSESLYISQQAMPILKSEAIQAQSANVDTVSGASDTSAAFRESLASALASAKA
ncbi:MAG: FMN-binding protein [Patescibacteria group bacterium]|nr:FMN-binding protein [Patescibacteria group bacterium]